MTWAWSPHTHIKVCVWGNNPTKLSSDPDMCMLCHVCPDNTHTRACAYTHTHTNNTIWKSEEWLCRKALHDLETKRLGFSCSRDVFSVWWWCLSAGMVSILSGIQSCYLFKDWHTRLCAKCTYMLHSKEFIIKLRIETLLESWNKKKSNLTFLSFILGLK